MAARHITLVDRSDESTPFNTVSIVFNAEVLYFVISSRSSVLFSLSVCV